MRALVGLLVLAAPLWGASQPASTRPSVVAGSTIRVPLALVRDADEMELVLSLDGGATFPIRVTREIAPGTESILWLVPNLPAAHARLALRAGENGQESIRDVGAEFDILPNPAVRPEDVRRQSGEWRTSAARDRATSAVPASGFGTGRECIGNLETHTTAETPSSVSELSPACDGTLLDQVVHESPPRTAASSLTVPRDRPRRE